MEFRYTIEDRIEAEHVLIGLRLVAAAHYRKSSIDGALNSALGKYHWDLARQVDRHITRLEEALDPTPDPVAA